MTLPTSVIPAKRRVRRKRRGVGSGEPIPVPLLLTSVEDVQIAGGQLSMNLVFNTPDDDPMNDPSGADPSKWTARYQGQTYVGVLVAPVILNTLFLLMDPVAAEAGADVLAYANAPSDISDSIGRFLAAFSGFALS